MIASDAVSVLPTPEECQEILQRLQAGPSQRPECRLVSDIYRMSESTIFPPQSSLSPQTAPSEEYSSNAANSLFRPDSCYRARPPAFRGFSLPMNCPVPSRTRGEFKPVTQVSVSVRYQSIVNAIENSSNRHTQQTDVDEWFVEDWKASYCGPDGKTLPTIGHQQATIAHLVTDIAWEFSNAVRTGQPKDRDCLLPSLQAHFDELRGDYDTRLLEPGSKLDVVTRETDQKCYEVVREVAETAVLEAVGKSN